LAIQSEIASMYVCGMQLSPLHPSGIWGTVPQGPERTLIRALLSGWPGTTSVSFWQSFAK
jgi:hypothetical protein